MKLHHVFIAATALAGASGANAAVIGSLGGGFGPFLSLSAAGLNGGSVATLAGGTIYTSDQPFADIPAGGVFENTFLGAGPTSTNPAVLTFVSGVDYLSFLWGSPDTYNVLTVTSTTGSYQFDVGTLGFAVTNGDQSFSQYVQFDTSGLGELITSVTFDTIPAIDAFEVANFSITPVPEPASWAMMIGGFGLIGGAMRSRRKVAVRYA